MNLPTLEEVEEIWDEYHVPEIIRNHCRAVTKVAVFIAKKLKEKGIHVDVGLVERSCLLHDITRSANFDNFKKIHGTTDEDVEFWKDLRRKYGNISHGESAGDVLKEKYPEVAEVIRTHCYESKIRGAEGWSWEMKIINYADYRVLHDKIVSIKERFKDARKRHGDFIKKLNKEMGTDVTKKAEKITKELEKEIFGIIDSKPDDINEETV